MEVKIAELKNNLSRHIKAVSQTGESVIILDRNKPVARLMPLSGKKKAPEDSAWEKERTETLARAEKLGIHLTIPLKRPKLLRDIPLPAPRLAPDGRTDVNSVVEMRRERDY